MNGPKERNPLSKERGRWWVAFAIALAVLLGTERVGAAPKQDARPRSIVILISDGCGPQSFGLARIASGRPLALDEILVGSVLTSSSSHVITESAAGATAYATGVRTKNRVVSLDPEGYPLRTLFEAAAARGMATGLVVKSRITDATPAAFVAHARDRREEDEIAEQQLEHRVDLMFGGGRGKYLPRSVGGSRRDSVDMLERARGLGYQVVTRGVDFRGALRLPVLALPERDDLPYEIDRDSTAMPDLPELTRRALELLSKRPKGFVLLVEGSRIDHSAHDNDPATHLREVLEYDRAARVVLDFARRDGRTLVVGTSDHETGGLALGRRIGDKSPYEIHVDSLLTVRWSTERMADSVEAGHFAPGMFESVTALHLSDEERAMVADAVTAKKRLAETFGEIVSRHALIGWTTWGHTATAVPLYAFGPGSARFHGVMENAAVGRAIAESAGLEIGARTGPALTRP